MQTTVPTTDSTTPPEAPAWSALATLALVALADYLILSAAPGVGWFAFALAMALAIGGLTLARGDMQRCLLAVGLGVTSALPLIEAPSLPGVGAAAIGLAAATLFASGLLPTALERIPAVMLRFAALLPVRLLGDGVATLSTRRETGVTGNVLRHLAGWIIPLVFVAIFAGLFIAANPVIDLAASRLEGLSFPNPLRLLLWAGFASIAWALLQPRLLALRTIQHATPTTADAPESLLFGRAAILRSLVIFNAIFAVQTLMDLTYLWGGVALPEGMTYADYAHRGAIPLMATSLLAAAFVLAAMRRNGPGRHSVLIRRLVYAWIGQNILLCISSLLRLDLYVEAYSLTELRLVAGIWMGLVAVGLLLILLRIALDKSNGWLVATNLLSLTVVLYGCAWLDFSALIARFNVEHSQAISGRGEPLDLRYLRRLGPTAIPALDDYIARAGRPLGAIWFRDQLAEDFAEVADWRGWSWRGQRIADYLDSTGRNDDNQANVPR